MKVVKNSVKKCGFRAVEIAEVVPTMRRRRDELGVVFDSRSRMIAVRVGSASENKVKFRIVFLFAG